MKFMSHEERDLWNALLDEVIALGLKSSADKGAAVIDRLQDAEQAHEPWGATTIMQLAEDQAKLAVKARQKQTSTTLVAFTQASAMRSMRVGVRNSSDAYEQVLFEEMTWEQLNAHVQMLQQQMRQLGLTIGVDRKLLKLHEQVPASAGPGDACKVLGVTVEQYLGSAAA